MGIGPRGLGLNVYDLYIIEYNALIMTNLQGGRLHSKL